MLMLKPLISFENLKMPMDISQVFSRKAPLDVEIGFGQGEVLVRKAQQFPERNFIGIEMNWERIVKTLQTIQNVQLKSRSKVVLGNVKILKMDARVVFERVFPNALLEHVYCYFPEPWPKKRHIKNRLFSSSFLNLLNSRSTEQAQFHLVTDYEPFFKWVLQESEETEYDVQTDKKSFHFETKFEKKWKQGGQNKFFEVTMIKKKQLVLPVKEGVVLNSYKVNTFNPDHFVIGNDESDITIIIRDQVYDTQRKKMIIHVLISEEDLTQNFRIVVFCKNEYWRICAEDGQAYFPTEGVNKALDLVHEAVKKAI